MTACSSDNIRQTLFLGCSVESFSCNLGFNEQPTELVVRIIEDTCASPAGTNKVYYDVTDVNDVEKTWTAADPGFYSFGPGSDEPPKLGAAVYFRFADFEFCGILQSWVKLDTNSDTNTYEVSIVSPVQILEGCQIIIDDYTGPIVGLNLFNVFGFQEVFSQNAYAPYYTDPRYPVDGPIMGSLSNAFGGANANRNGMSWNKIKQGINILTSSLIRISDYGYEEFSQVGRITYYGGQSNASFGLIPRDAAYPVLGVLFSVSTNIAFYTLDISELPEVPDYYRIAGPSINLLSLISQICNDFSLDYYIELVPVWYGGSLHKIIKIRTIARNVQPSTDIVQQYIDATPEVIDSSFGRELRNENTTTFLIGGQKRSVWQVDNGLPDPGDDPEESWFNTNFPASAANYVRDRIVPFFGKRSDGSAYILYTSGTNPNDSFIPFDFVGRHNWIILNDVLPATIPVTIQEMRQAAEGYDSWSFHVRAANRAIYQHLRNVGLDIDTVFNPNLPNNNKIQPRDLAGVFSKTAPDQLTYELKQYVEAIANIYDQSKRTFMVRAPWIVARYHIDSSIIADSWTDLGVEFTDEPIEGAWTEADSVLELPNPSAYVDRMRLEDGTIRPFAKFDLFSQSGISQTSKTLSEFNTDESFAIDRNVLGIGNGIVLYYACNQDLEPIFLDRPNLVSPRVIVQFNTPLDFDSDENNSFYGANSWQSNSRFLPVIDGNFSTFVALTALQSVEREYTINYIDPPVREPDSIAIMLKSNVHTYGPWKPNNVIEAGPPGQTKVEKHDDLVPWTYGSYLNLDDVAISRANEAVTVMNEGEVGNVTIHGVPNIPIGAELASLNGLVTTFYTSGYNLYEDRVLTLTPTTVYAVNGTPSTFSITSIPFGFWNGSYGPTVTSINVRFGRDGITTNYGFRTYTPKFGVLSKLNTQRLEQRYIYENNRRANIRFLEEARFIQNKYIQSLRQIGHGLSKHAKDGDIRAQPGTPHSVLVGQLSSWTSGYARSIIATKDLYELQNNLTSSTGYNNIAIMSFDGLVRPVSMDGAGGLPRYVSNATSPRPVPISSIPPFGTGNDDFTSQYNWDLSINYWNPLNNPTGFNRAKISERHSGVSAHDIDIVARSGYLNFTGSGTSLIMPLDINALNSNKNAHYANDYRFMALRGPLILQGWGYDTNGKPIPNSADSESAISGNGQFVSTSLTDKFLSDFLKKPQTWPVAPVDLRFDRNRNLWVAPPEYELVTATCTENILPYMSGAATINLNNTYDGAGIELLTGKIKVIDKVGISHAINDKVIAYFDKKSNAYTIIESLVSGGGGGAELLYFEVIQNRITPSITVSGRQVNCPTGTGGVLYYNYLTEPFLLYDYEQKFVLLSGYKGYATPITCSGGSTNYHIVNVEKQFPYTFITSGNPVSEGNPEAGREIPAATWNVFQYTITPSRINGILMKLVNNGRWDPIFGTENFGSSSIVLENHFTQSIMIPQYSGIIGKASLISGNLFKIISIDCGYVKVL